MALVIQRRHSHMSSSTTTTMSAVGTAPNPSKRPAQAAIYRWPQPELSIGERSGSMGFLGKYKCWKIKEKSPAHLVWKSVSKRIVNLLEDQFEHLDAKDKHLQVEIFMIGKEVASSSPTILFSCPAKTCRRRAIDLVQKNSILVHHPGVLMAECARLPGTLAKEELLNSDLKPGVYSNGPVSHNGISILVVGARGTPRKATLGGIVRMEDGFYGLTVKHAFSENANSQSTEETDDDEFAFYGSGELDERSDDESSSVEITSHGSISSSSVRSKSSDTRGKSHQPSQTPSPKDPATALATTTKDFETEDLLSTDYGSYIKHSRYRIGELLEVTPPDESLDWALVRLSKQSVLFRYPPSPGRDVHMINEGQQRDIFMNRFVLQNRRSCVPEGLAELPRDADVMIFTGNNVLPLQGRLSGVPSYAKPPGYLHFQEFWTVTSIDGCLAEGDSGSWVIDKEYNELYGHVAAGYTDTKTAYIVPAIHLFAEMDHLVGQVSVPTPANWSLRDTQDLAFERVSTPPLQQELESDISQPWSKNKDSSDKSPGDPLRLNSSLPYTSAPATQLASRPQMRPTLSEGPPRDLPQSTQSRDSKISLNPGRYIPNPTNNVLYMGHLPVGVTKEALIAVFSQQHGYVSLYFGSDHTGPMCYISFKDVQSATKAMREILVPGFEIHKSEDSENTRKFSNLYSMPP